MAKRDYIDPYEFTVDIGTDVVEFGFDYDRELVLFGGSYSVTFPQKMTMDEILEDIKKNYADYKQDDLMATYRAWGYYD